MAKYGRKLNFRVNGPPNSGNFSKMYSEGGIDATNNLDGSKEASWNPAFSSENG